MEMAVVFREGQRSLSGKIMRTIFHSIKPLHLAQLATHTKVKERDPVLYDRGVVHLLESHNNKRNTSRTPEFPQSSMSTCLLPFMW